ncbi:helix-turn-helix transcriptional regulator [Maritalea mediterranea]|uniref:Transcriptional regulator n=1 Tax=Maritalea mediterranea TaxID=2909667 RepID=A0ABS9E852_9HYPH|nr:metalloregulator ArsR/SmtB family transcription factor [Maritalea mediterranea]MCF4098983.1 transcriptional regulator [Maritalea mediterranea]
MKQSEDKTIERLLYLLKSRGDQTAVSLAESVGTTPVAVRQHMEKLLEQGLVAGEDRRESVGRPKKYWKLTEKGHSRFPDRHSDLTTELLGSIEDIYGEEGLERLISAREKRAFELYRKKVSAQPTLQGKVQALADLREREGYMTEVEPCDNGYFLHENHCPICVAATKCQGFCRSELNLFRDVLGKQVNVVRESHIVSGARRCTYRIVEASQV